MAEIKYFSPENAKVFAKEVKALIEAAKTAATYDDAAVVGRIAALEGDVNNVLKGADSVTGSVAEAKKAGVDAASAVATEESRAKGAEKALADRLDVIEGEGDGSIKKAAEAAVSQVVAGAGADFDTLKEIEAWIGAHETAQSAANLVTKVSTLEGKVGSANTATEGESNATGLYKELEAVKKLAEAANGDISKLGDLASKDKVVEGDIDGTLAISKIAGLQDALDAKQGVIADETYDAFGAAAAAETRAKAYADGLAVNYDAKGDAAKALADAKDYADSLKDTHTDMTESEVKALFTTAD